MGVKLVMIRHGAAVPRGTPGIPDDERPLSPRGERRFRRAARGLASIARRPDVILTSPLPRAFRTAEIAARAWGRLEPIPEAVLSGGRVEAVLALLARQPRGATIAIVGHEPHLSALLGRLLGMRGMRGMRGTRESERLAFRKGGAALVEIGGAPTRGGRLVWLLAPKVLRALGRR